MSRIIFLLVLTVGIASPASAAKRVSIDQFEQLLAAAHGQSDRKVAGQIADLELTERANSVRLARWETDFPGHHCREALTELADASAFLELPAADMPTFSQPDRETQKTMLAKAIDYVNKTFSRLPNFYATRKTQHFEDTPPHQTLGGLNMPATGRGARSGGIPNVSSELSQYEPMHSSGKSSESVGYRDGYEIRNSQKIDRSSLSQPVQGLTTAGEFGPILSVVLQDSVRGKRTWGFWEQGAGSVEAVFRYTVPAGIGSYMVALPRGKRTEQIFPAYHGEIAVDPASGDILRITVVADFAPPNEEVMTAILVEYAATSIGGTSYICPIRSVALSKMPGDTGDDGKQAQSSLVQTQLNDVAFTDYHLFRTESRILTGSSAIGAETPAGPAPAEPTKK
ncbi:MAG TPA: hypothetical protein VFC37_21385 [Terracidiphilus sp.]|nr:hypothetical protein [Terracidiphilus sp.]